MPDALMVVGCDEDGIGMASRTVGSGGVIVFPTDTVYGMGCDPYDRGAVERIYRIKSRDASKPLPVLAGSMGAVERIARLDERSRVIVSRHWPGPLTVILRLADPRLSASLNLEDRIAVRIPDHPCTLDLLRGCGRQLLVGTSANVSGQQPFADPGKCPGGIMAGCDLFVDGGATPQGSASTIIEVTGDGGIRVVRQGACRLDGGEVPGA